MKRKQLAGCTFSILGDSYSTFVGYIPAGNACYYPRPESVDDVLRVEDTWWYQLMQRKNMRLLYNESYSGATVCTHVRDTQPPESSFTVRARYLSAHTDEKGEGPECIFLFGCTNDSWLEREIGQVQFANWTEKDLSQVLPAYCYVLDVLCKEHPQACVACVVNTGLNPLIAEGIRQASEHYGAVTVALTDIDKQNGHPSALGMRQIAEQMEAALELPVHRNN